jgi:membrane fusion protein (multidrug efflux system)
MTLWMDMRRLLLPIGLLGTLVLSACAQSAPEEVESEAVVPVRIEAAATGSIRGIVHASGVVSPAPGAELVVVAPESARIAEIPRGEGDRVRRGDVLVRFEIPNTAAEVERQEAEVRRAKAAVANATANQTRARDLFQRGVAARKEVEDADRQVADAQAAVEQAEASRAAASTVARRSVVRATFNGLVAKRYHNPGDLVEASVGDPVLRVLDPQRFEVVASVPLAEASRVVVGATGRLAAVPTDAPRVGLKVISTPAAVERGTSSVPVRLAFDAPARLPAGSPVLVEIEAENHADVVLVPASAIVREGEETAVFVAKDNKAERRAVRIGLSDGEHVEILSGIAAGDQVIVEGQAGLPDGAAITTATGDKPGTAAADKDKP